jgi:dephospho-CoA kinase
MIILGLTGSIGMGKTTAGNRFRDLGVPVFDADAVVHKLLGPDGEATAEVAAAFPGAATDGAIDRARLGALVFGQPDELRRLEAILHPKVRDARERFLKHAERSGETMVVVEVPLLFEGGSDAECTHVAVVSAPPAVQRARVLKRPNMTPQKLDAILAQQMPDEEKRRRADFVIPTGGDKAKSLQAIRDIVTLLRRPSADPSRPGA